MAHFVIFFAGQVRPLKTKLNKLLFYADFYNFKRLGQAISGCNYRAIRLGPVPSHFSELFSLLEDTGYVEMDYELTENGLGERLIPAQEFNSELFSEEELQSMKQVAAHFEDTKTTEIVDLSHQELGWIDNCEERELIDFQQYAFALLGI